MTIAEELKRLSRLAREQQVAELQTIWTELLDAEEAAFQLCCALDSKTPERNTEKSEAVRGWWKAVKDILWMFVKTRAEFNHELQPFPAFVLGRLANTSEELGNGIVPTLVEDARAGRGRPMRLGERKHIAYGVLYIEAVRRGEIDDPAPNKTVRQAYNVTAKAVQGWVKRRNVFCVGVPYQYLEPDKLKKKMLECADVYRRSGRGAPSEN